MSRIVYYPQWLDDESSWKKIYSDSRLVAVEDEEKARGYNAMIADLFRRDPAIIKLVPFVDEKVTAIAVDWILSGHGLPEYLLAEIQGAQYKAVLSELHILRIPVIRFNASNKSSPRWMKSMVKGFTGFLFALTGSLVIHAYVLKERPNMYSCVSCTPVAMISPVFILNQVYLGEALLQRSLLNAELSDTSFGRGRQLYSEAQLNAVILSGCLTLLFWFPFLVTTRE